MRKNRYTKKRQKHFSLEMSDAQKYPMPSAPPKRKYELCPISEKPIAHIYSAITHKETSLPAKLESVIEELTQAETLQEEEYIAYVGKGMFGIISKDEETHKFTIRKRIQYEDPHAVLEWRKELSPGISHDYIPNPQPVRELYTEEEMSAFPQFDNIALIRD